MPSKEIAPFWDRTSISAAKWINNVASFLLASMMFLTAIDVALRYIFQRPITGTYEIIEFMMAISNNISGKKVICLSVVRDKVAFRRMSISNGILLIASSLRMKEKSSDLAFSTMLTLLLFESVTFSSSILIM